MAHKVIMAQSRNIPIDELAKGLPQARSTNAQHNKEVIEKAQAFAEKAFAETTPEFPRVQDVFAYINDRLDFLAGEADGLRTVLKPYLKESYPSDIAPVFEEFQGESEFKNGLAQIGHRINEITDEFRNIRFRVDN